MGKVYLHRSGAPDLYIGRTDPDSGRVHRHRPGRDEYLGRVGLDTGKVHRHYPGPDEYVGRVDLKDGKVYSHRPGPDRYVAEAKRGGRVYRHKATAPDEYVGRVDGLNSLAEGGAAFLLLMMPALAAAKLEAGDEE